ncbi:hypothetical protein FNSP10_11950 [Fusobacterium nucleatum]|nr:hypothetical protein FNCP10_12380 [Fusobacterium nucleatum]BEP07821.1 hypothetical protein FNSP10_11950 [Fusobacterium nucleatum]
MKKMRAIENIKVEETLYKSGEEFEIAEEETQRLIDLGAAEFVNSEIEKAETEENNSEEETNVGGLKDTNSSKKGKKNE